jgi:hypothetical protein
MARTSHHDICRFQVTVNDPTLVKVEQAVEKLEQDGLDHRGGYGPPSWLRMVMNDLQQVMLAVFEDHEDAFILEDDFRKVYQIGM